jgi:protein-tyrosine phosphatase
VFSVIRHNQTQLEIHFSKALDNASSTGRDRDINTAERNLITDRVAGPVYLDDPLQARQRIYFIVEHAQNSWLFAERTLPISGMNNFRDMGGYTGAGGKRVKWGMLYRSNHL